MGRRATLRQIGLLLVTTPGVAALAAVPSALAQAAATPSSHESTTQEVVVSATRLEDEVVTAKVVQALKDDPFIFSDHITVVTQNGVVRLQGIATDPHDLRQALRIARRAAGKRRVLNEVELIAVDSPMD